jgi:hypothetical protein
MWPKRAHVLVPLTSLQGNKEIQWTDVHTQAFKAMKALMAKDCLLSYPDPNIPYDIETDASDLPNGSHYQTERLGSRLFFAEIARRATHLY